MVKSSNVKTLEVKSRGDDLLKEIDEYYGRKPKRRSVYSTRPLQPTEIREKIKELEEILATRK